MIEKDKIRKELEREKFCFRQNARKMFFVQESSLLKNWGLTIQGGFLVLSLASNHLL
jgi:hypothetical protein